ncbi:MAG TPA: class F sortase [Patescibacteria group bacterium]|nr:class F sortase [Patescibacteria group bacterium]
MKDIVERPYKKKPLINRQPVIQKRTVIRPKRWMMDGMSQPLPQFTKEKVSQEVSLASQSELPINSYFSEQIPSESLKKIQDNSASRTNPAKLIMGKFQRYNKGQTALILAGIMVFVTGMIVSFQGFKTNSHVTAQVNQNQSPEFTGDNPDENPPGDVNSYQVPWDSPKKIKINKLSVNALVRALGTKENGELKAPSNIYDTGWYNQSAKPGEHGAMLIDGHYRGPTKPGVFKNINNLVKGDVITIERGDGKTFDYKVVKTEVYDADKVPMASALVPIEPGKPGLNLITCGGKYNPSTKLYDERIMVFASLVE